MVLGVNQAFCTNQSITTNCMVCHTKERIRINGFRAWFEKFGWRLAKAQISEIENIPYKIFRNEQYFSPVDRINTRLTTSRRDDRDSVQSSWRHKHLRFMLNHTDSIKCLIFRIHFLHTLREESPSFGDSSKSTD